MKKISLLLILIISQQAFSQHSIKFEESSFASILAKAKAEKKLVFMDAYASWCGPCKMMDKQVFTQAEVGSTFNDIFINTTHFDNMEIIEKWCAENDSSVQKFKQEFFEVLAHLH